MRKTIELETLKKFVNNQLANDNNTIDEKQGMISVIEHALYRANSYRGFMFLDTTDGESIGSPGTHKHVRRKYF
jgi:hypothetical protein